jgi:hypothetical protein
MGKNITVAMPENYTAAMQKVGLALPANVTIKQHSILSPIATWFHAAATGKIHHIITPLPESLFSGHYLNRNHPLAYGQSLERLATHIVSITILCLEKS